MRYGEDIEVTAARAGPIRTEPGGETINATVGSFGEGLWDLLSGGPVLGGAPLKFIHHVSVLGHLGLMIGRVVGVPLGGNPAGPAGAGRSNRLSLFRQPFPAR